MTSKELKISNSRIAIRSLMVFSSWVLLVSLFACIFAWVVGKWPDSSGQLGQFGDFFGGVLNPLFSFSSFVLLGYSLIYTHGAYEVSLAASNLALLQADAAIGQLNFEREKHQKDLLDDEKKSRRDMTLTWHQNWMSPQMSLLKANALGEIQTRIINIEAGQASAFIGGLRNAGAVHIRKTYQEIKDVMRLIHHAITFFEDELLDKDLFLKLFEADFRQWHSVLNRLDMRAIPSDGSPDSLSEEAERTDLVERLTRLIGASNSRGAS